MKWHAVATVTAETAFVKLVNAGGKKICLVKYDQQYFALNAKCPHAGADLSRGWCTDKKLVCPVHRYSYRLDTGRGNDGQNDYVDVYHVEIKGDNVFVGIKSFWDWFN